jgi:hypothetical protein
MLLFGKSRDTCLIEGDSIDNCISELLRISKFHIYVQSDDDSEEFKEIDKSIWNSPNFRGSVFISNNPLEIDKLNNNEYIGQILGYYCASNNFAQNNNTIFNTFVIFDEQNNDGHIMGNDEISNKPPVTRILMSISTEKCGNDSDINTITDYYMNKLPTWSALLYSYNENLHVGFTITHQA